MFQDMMDRIEDETIKFLFFMRIESGPGGGGLPGGGVPVPHPELLDDGDGEEEEDEEEETRQIEARAAERAEASRKEAERSVLDLTRNIQRKKDRELAGLQLSNGDGTASQKPVSNNGPKVGRNDPCPCGSGKKYKRCHGAAA
jgi:preprotein translocase subunit SecA